MVRKMCKKIFIIMSIVGYVFIIKYFFNQLLPFLLAFLCYFLLKPIIEKIEKKFHIHKNTIGMTLLMSLYFIFIIILFSIIFCIVIYVLRRIQDIPYFYQSLIEPFFTETISWIENQFPYFTQQDFLTFIYEYSGQILLYLMNSLSSLLTHVPTLFFSFLYL